MVIILLLFFIVSLLFALTIYCLVVKHWLNSLNPGDLKIKEIPKVSKCSSQLGLVYRAEYKLELNRARSIDCCFLWQRAGDEILVRNLFRRKIVLNFLKEDCYFTIDEYKNTVIKCKMKNEALLSLTVNSKIAADVGLIS